MGLRHSIPETPRDVFFARSVEMLKRLSSTAPLETLNRALASPSDIGGVATFLSDLALLGVDTSTVDPFAEAMARGTLLKQEMLKEAGGGFTVSQVAAMLGISRQAVDKRRLRGTLLALPNGSGDYLYPACQFNLDGVLPHFEEVLQAIPLESPWTRLSALLGRTPALGGKNILEALASGDRERALAVAESVGEQAG